MSSFFWTFDVFLSNFSWYVGYWKNTSFTYDSFQQLLKFLVEVAIQFLKKTSNNVATLSRNYTITCYFSVCSLVLLVTFPSAVLWHCGLVLTSCVHYIRKTDAYLNYTTTGTIYLRYLRVYGKKACTNISCSCSGI